MSRTYRLRREMHRCRNRYVKVVDASLSGHGYYRYAELVRIIAHDLLGLPCIFIGEDVAHYEQQSWTDKKSGKIWRLRHVDINVKQHTECIHAHFSTGEGYKRMGLLHDIVELKDPVNSISEIHRPICNKYRMRAYDSIYHKTHIRAARKLNKYYCNKVRVDDEYAYEVVWESYPTSS